MPEFSGIAAELAERCVALGLTQQTLADLAGVSRSTVQALEYGRTSVSLSAFLDILDILGLDARLTTTGANR